MSRSGRIRNCYLYEDRLFGELIFYYHNGGRKAIALIVLAYVIPAIVLMFTCYLRGQTWFDLWNMYIWALMTPDITFTVILEHMAYVSNGEKRLASDAVLLHVLSKLNDRCPKNSIINWRAIAHSANKFSEELGESHMVFFSGFHCMWYVIYHAVDAVNNGWPVFEDKSGEVSKRHNDIAKSAVRKYKARLEFFCSNSDRYSKPAVGLLEELQERLRIKEVHSH